MTTQATSLRLDDGQFSRNARALPSYLITASSLRPDKCSEKLQKCSINESQPAANDNYCSVDTFLASEQGAIRPTGYFDGRRLYARRLQARVTFLAMAAVL